MQFVRVSVVAQARNDRRVLRFRAAHQIADGLALFAHHATLGDAGGRQRAHERRPLAEQALDVVGPTNLGRDGAYGRAVDLRECGSGRSVHTVEPSLLGPRTSRLAATLLYGCNRGLSFFEDLPRGACGAARMSCELPRLLAAARLCPVDTGAEIVVQGRGVLKPRRAL